MIQTRLVRNPTNQPGARHWTMEPGRAGGQFHYRQRDIWFAFGRGPAHRPGKSLGGLSGRDCCGRHNGMLCRGGLAIHPGGRTIFIRARGVWPPGRNRSGLDALAGTAGRPAATADLFVIYCGEFWPQATEPLSRFLILTFLYGILTFINYRGVRASTQVSNIFTVAKLVPLVLVAVAGTFYLASHHATPLLATGAERSSWLKAALLLVFAYGGFETAMTPLSEAKNPRRDAAFALFTALVTCTLLYSVIQWVVVGVLPDPGHSERPLADVARLAFGHGGAAFVSVGALISVYGYLSANILGVPRITFALAENGDFPSIFAAIHPRFRTPYVSILAFALLSWLLALLGSFTWNATLSAVARLLYYGLVCAALPVLRRRQLERQCFAFPEGFSLQFWGSRSAPR
jgi:amino acid transporter